MKSLALFCSVMLVVLPAFAEVTPGTTTSLGSATATAPNWSAAIQKFSKESSDTAPDTVDTRLLIDHLSDNDPVAKGAAAASAAATAPAAGASAAVGKTGESKSLAAGTMPSDFDKSGGDDDWAAAARQSIRDIVKPYQEFLPGSSETSPKPVAEGAGSGQLQGPYASGGPAAPSRGEGQRRTEKIRSDYLISQLIDELLPWAIGAGVVGAFGYGLSLWVSYVKRRPSVSVAKSSSTSTRPRSGKKHRRRSI